MTIPWPWRALVPFLWILAWTFDYWDAVRCTKRHRTILTWSTTQNPRGIPVLYVQCLERKCRRPSLGVLLTNPPRFQTPEMAPYWWVGHWRKVYLLQQLERNLP